MGDRPIIFSAPMVRALLDGRKTQTRRILKDVPPQPSDDNVVHDSPKHEHAYFDSYCSGKKTADNPRGMSEDWCWWTRDDRCGSGCKVRFVPGDRLYVRENWCHTGEGVWTIADARRQMSGHPIYKATDTADAGTKWWPSIHMPREFSRLTLIVTNVKVERLQDISEADAIAEGVVRLFPKGSANDTGPNHFTVGADGWSISAPTAVETYRLLWQWLHGAESWDANPFVVAITFSVVRGNIDRVQP